MRHTHATLLLVAGVNPKIVSERLGHSSVAFTMDVYSHVVPNLQETAAERFDQLIFYTTPDKNNVVKGAGFECEPHRSRTCNLLIKRLKTLFAALLSK